MSSSPTDCCAVHYTTLHSGVDLYNDRVRPSLYQQDLIVQGGKCVIYKGWSVYCTSVPCVVYKICILHCSMCTMHVTHGVQTSNYSGNKEDFDIKSNHIFIYFFIIKKKKKQKDRKRHV